MVTVVAVVSTVGIAVVAVEDCERVVWLQAANTRPASSNSSYTPQQFDLVKVQVAVPASLVLWFPPTYFAPSVHAIYSSQVVMMRAS